MADILKALLKASRAARKGRPFAAASALQLALFPAKPSRRKRPAALAQPKARHKRSVASLRRPDPGSFISGHFESRQGSLAYRLYTPTGSRRRRMPLVVMLHGCSQNATDFALGTGMNRLADEIGFIVLYPQQNHSANVARCWNWHAPEHQKRGSGEPAMIAGLTHHVMMLTRANPARIYVAGLSAGAGAAAVLGSAYPDIFAAVGIHSGVAPGQIRSLRSALSAMRGEVRPDLTSRIRRPLPTIVFHGDQDRTVHPSNARSFLTNLERSRPGPLVSHTVSGSSAGGRTFTRKIHKTADGVVMLEDWIIHGSGHGWSGGHGAGSFTDPVGPDASREIIRFFLARRRPE